MKALLKNLPDAPGVYLMKNKAGEIIYVGKARSLKKRVSSYFSKSNRDTRLAARHLGRMAKDVDFIVTDNETEAFILENNLIKKHKPFYNIQLKDDKTFLCLRVDMSHPFPSIVPVRRPKRDGRLYFGPYASARALRTTLKILRTVVPLRDCSDREFSSRKRPCIKHQIGRCSAPCVDLITREDYARNLERALLILKGKVDGLIEGLGQEMVEASRSMAFERAAQLRDRIGMLEAFAKSQKVEDIKFFDVDVIGTWQSGGLSEVVVLFFREGKLVQSRPYTFTLKLDAVELLSQFLSRFYDGRRYVPETVLIPHKIPEMGELEAHLKRLRKGPVHLKAAARGDAAKLLHMAEENARLSLKASRQSMERTARVQERLKEVYGLMKAPLAIEGLDISTTGGSEAVGAVVHFHNGQPRRSRYRRYRIRTVEGMDDYAMVREVTLRRLKRGIEERNLPDLILVDGGIGQVNSALAAAAELGVASVDFLGIEKGETRARAVAKETDRIVSPRKESVVDLGSAELHLLQRVRDEAHRFAITYHRKRRRKAGLSSPVDRVHGLGEKKKRALLTHFGGLKGLKKATCEEIARAPGIGPVLAERIHRALHR